MRHVAYALVGILSLLAAFCALAGSPQASGTLASVGAVVLATLVTTGAAPSADRAAAGPEPADRPERDGAETDELADHRPSA